MRLALAQLNVVVGDLDGNRAKILGRLADARDAGADLVVYPELARHGLPAGGSPPPPRVRPRSPRLAGGDRAGDDRHRRARRNAVVRPRSGERLRRMRGRARAGRSTASTSSRTTASSTSIATSPRAATSCCSAWVTSTSGPTVCEDLWQPGPPATDLALAGAQLIVNLSASPFHVGKAEEREEMLVTRARDTSSYLAFCNLVGGQDELVFDGHSVVLDDAGEVVARAPGFEEHLLVVDVEPDLAIGRRLRDVRRRELDRSRESVPTVEIVELDAPDAVAREAARPGGGAVRARARADAPRARPRAPRLRREERFRAGRGRGLRRDRLRRHRSALRRRLRRRNASTACRCRRSSPRKARGTTLGGWPRASAATSARSRSRTSSTRSSDALERADGRARRARCGEPPGAGPRSAPHGALEHVRLARRLDGEQVGARSRLLDPVRRHGRRVRAPEGRVQDRRVPARAPPERARGRELIPTTTIERAPSAELRADQRDEDSIPPYDVLDPVLEAYVELDRSREELLDEFDAEIVEQVVSLVDRAEYKRRQAPPGVKLRPKAFGRDRRTPITNRWRG